MERALLKGSKNREGISIFFVGGSVLHGPQFRSYVGSGKEEVPEQDCGTSQTSLDPRLT